jgi:hypothetical protein
MLTRLSKAVSFAQIKFVYMANDRFVPIRDGDLNGQRANPASPRCFPKDNVQLFVFILTLYPCHFAESKRKSIVFFSRNINRLGV